MSYTIDRADAAKLLNCSTRTIDRHIRSGKVRSKRIGKKVFLHDEDIRIIQNGGLQEDYIVLDAEGQTIAQQEEESGFSRRPVMVDYKGLFEDAQKAIERKDAVIQELSYRVGQAEAELKNSISMIEYKKTTFLLESSNKKSEEEKKELSEKVAILQESTTKLSTVNIALLVAVVVLFLASVGFWFMSL